MLRRWIVFLRKRAATLLALVELLVRRSELLRMLVYTRRKKLTFLGVGALANLALAVDATEQQGIPGIMIETGTALGGSAILIARAKQPARPLFLFDTFEVIPQPTAEDGEDAHRRYAVIQAGEAHGFDDELYYGYQEQLEQKVENAFDAAGLPIGPNNISLRKGLIENTLQIDQPVALAHIDCDWYSPVMTSLQQIVPYLQPGGQIIVDDYYQWSGARKAVDEYFKDRRDVFAFQHRARLHIIRRA